jgi:hypothetical protein
VGIRAPQLRQLNFPNPPQAVNNFLRKVVDKTAAKFFNAFALREVYEAMIPRPG